MTAADPPNELLSSWQRALRLPAGRTLFNRLLGRKVPYTGTISPQVLSLAPGSVRVAIADRRRVRNHLESIHAAALTNLGELATGLAVTSSLPRSARAIPIRLSIDFLKKARGTITADCRFALDRPPEEPEDHELVAVLRDSAGEEVARVSAHWRIGPRG